MPCIVLIPQWLSHIDQSGKTWATGPFLGMSCEKAGAVLPQNKDRAVWKLWNVEQAQGQRCIWREVGRLTDFSWPH